MEEGTRESGGEAADDGGVQAGEASGPTRMRWDQIFPKRSLRILLVEHDDSTRQVVTALLRKCSYLVAAVADGLKAWEIIQERKYKFDLVLTEVDMPSLSGIGLLTKLVSTEECKNVPVIMMSSQDSIGVVLKCMLKGAADFLVKPVRKNELKNLWQHVWRRQFSSQASGASENNAASNKISANNINLNLNIIGDDVSKTGENSDNANEVQSSENKQDMEIESAQNFTNAGTVPVIPGPLLLRGEIVSEKPGTSTTINDKKYDDSLKENSENCETKSLPIFNEDKNIKGKTILSTKSDVAEFFKPPFNVLNHSQGSAFARYGEKKTQNSNLNASSSSSQIDQNPNNQLRFIPVPVPIGSGSVPVPFGYTTIIHPIYYSSFPSDIPVLVPVPDNNNNYNNNNNNIEEEDMREMSQETNQNNNQASCSHNKDYYNITGKANPGLTTALESGNESTDYCNITGKTNPGLAATLVSGNESTDYYMMRGSREAGKWIPGLESGNESTAQTGDKSRREAALIKFRMKRKDRCFEKKVRYYNRKKLAEQRPRVKGQFVSQKTNQSNPEIDG